MKITNVRTTLLTGPCSNDPYVGDLMLELSDEQYERALARVSEYTKQIEEKQRQAVKEHTCPTRAVP